MALSPEHSKEPTGGIENDWEFVISDHPITALRIDAHDARDAVGGIDAGLQSPNALNMNLTGRALRLIRDDLRAHRLLGRRALRREYWPTRDQEHCLPKQRQQKGSAHRSQHILL
jgi:hypothetical protein